MASGRPKLSSMTDEEKLKFYDESIEKHKSEIRALKEKKKIVMEKIKKADLIRINEAVKKSNKSVDEIINLISK